MKISHLDTPALIIDLDRVEKNVRRWQEFCDRAGLKNRPHIKTHKIPELAKLQVEYGAVGITCQKLGEAEVMADAGLSDIFLTYNIVGSAKLERLRALHQRIRLRVVADGREVVDGLEAAASKGDRRLEVSVECDSGMHRCGVQSPQEAVDLAEFIRSKDSLRFSGFSTYPTTADAAAFIEEVEALCQERGLEIPEISGGGTPGMWRLPPYRGFTEHRAGTYIFNDRITVAGGDATWADCASSVLVSVVSTSGLDWITVDGGTKTFSTDQYGQTGFGVLWDDPQTLLTRCSEEHGVLQSAGAKPGFALGQKLRVIPNHACIVSNLHDVAYAVRGDSVVAEWRVAARGKLQ